MSPSKQEEYIQILALKDSVKVRHIAAEESINARMTSVILQPLVLVAGEQWQIPVELNTKTRLRLILA